MWIATPKKNLQKWPSYPSFLNYLNPLQKTAHLPALMEKGQLVSIQVCGSVSYVKEKYRR